MVGPGAQKNKGHKAGRRAGLSARDKHKNSKDAGGMRRSVKASRSTAQTKAERLNAAKQQRDHKRAAALDQRRAAAPPRVVALLPLSADVDVQRLWSSLLASCSAAGDDAAAESASNGKAGAAAGMELDASSSACPPLVMTTLSVADRRRVRFTFLPPPAARSDPLAIVELARSAECVLLAMPGDVNTETIDAAGSMALNILGSLGLPSITALVQAPAASASKNVLKERSAAKKHATNALLEQLPGDHKLLAADTPLDFKQLLRHLSDSAPSVPHWRQHRPALLVEAASFEQQQAAGPEGAAVGTLLLRGYVRGLGLSANQAVYIAGAGDFQLQQIEGPSEPPSANEPAAGASQGAAMDTAGEVAVLALPDPAQRESLVRENVPDPLAGEQTWPTEEELKEAAATRKPRKRRLPKGTSDYQAAWILDDSDLDDTDLESDSEDDEARGRGGSDDMSLPDLEHNDRPGGGGSLIDVDAGTEFGMDYEDDDEDEQDADKLAGMQTSLKQRQRQEQDDQLFPDEVDTPDGVPARQRFDKYRGLKSFRTAPWDPRESLPQDYSRVFAFENFRRAHKRAIELSVKAGAAGNEHGVPAGTYVQLRVAAVPADAAARVLQRVASSQQEAVPPLVVFGLLQHECKLSVQHYGMRKASGFEAPLPSKEQLLLVNGLRSFYARPVYSSDEHGADKFKMERFLHEGRSTVATVYAPIAYPPLPVLAFKMAADGGTAQLVASGSLRSCDPDRIVLKKIVLSGYPVKVHKTKAVVRFMFHNPDDVRWFRPVEVWTKGGRRGRIREPVGTHGAMKCIFDGNLSQQDAVMMSLYKRVFPKWPADLDFVA
ncbi:hypothetical protein D9Q98_004203 [Chlorella vulgaris]|uniref:Bms1-type G domain-containing protein n=1 Tax=Chlorella vulgaris TaxID=3077 RepID=A0A9D4TRJ8_CHLVU|nr:hypothetical protein D9Q98_004203 [Chlorella vulgaris]